ncbi:MAG: RNA polymerase sigma factor [Kineosporiaceae bacterium]
MDPSEFEALYEREFPRLKGQLTVLCGDPDEAADCVQEAFVRAWQHRRELAADGSPGGWVRTAAVRVATSRWRRARTAGSAWQRLGARPGPPPADPGDAGCDETVRALRELPAGQRHVLALHYLLDLPVAEIADLVRASEGAVKVRLHRGRQALAARLAVPEDVPAHHPGRPEGA